MFKAAVLLFALSALSAVVDASAHAHGGLSSAHSRGVHRRHHAKIQAAGQPRTVRKRRSCTTKASSDALAISSSIPSATSLVVDAPAAAATTPVELSTAAVASSAEDATSASQLSSSPAVKAVATSNNAAISPNSNLRAIFPVAANIKWTTSLFSGSAFPLSDATLRPTNVLSKLSHNYVTMAGRQAMRAHYAAGSWNFQQEPLGGFSFYAPGPASVDLTTAKEATLSYSVLFEDGFEFVMGGKLPGFCAYLAPHPRHDKKKLTFSCLLDGGDSNSGSISCSGGRRDAKCFSSRFMWRTNGAMELYTYLPPTFDANNAVCNIPPFSECNPTYGASVGRGIVSFAPGQWMTLSQRVRLNDVGQENGEIEVFANGRSLFTASGLVLRDSAAGRIRGIQAQTFFGGKYLMLL